MISCQSIRSANRFHLVKIIQQRSLVGLLILFVNFAVKIRQLEKDGKPKTYPNRESKIRDALVMNEQEPNYWTQYNRTHGYLGRIRGNGVSKDYPDRPAYNIFTGIKHIIFIYYNLTQNDRNVLFFLSLRWTTRQT